MSKFSDTSPVSTFNMIDIEESIRLAKLEATKHSATLLAQVRDKAREIISAAMAESTAIKQRARDEGHKLGHEEGLKLGKAKGEEAEKAVAREALKPQAEALGKILSELPAQLAEARQRLLDESERDLLGLALEAASMAVAHAVREPSVTVRAELMSLAGLYASRRHMVIETNPEHVASLESLLPGLREQFSELGDVRLRGVAGLAPMSVRVVTDHGEAAVSPEGALARLKSEWGV